MNLMAKTFSWGLLTCLLAVAPSYGQSAGTEEDRPGMLQVADLPKNGTILIDGEEVVNRGSLLQRHHALFIAPGEYVVAGKVDGRTVCTQVVTIKANETTTLRCGREVVKRKEAVRPAEAQTSERPPVLQAAVQKDRP